jgi:hypothetical protein
VKRELHLVAGKRRKKRNVRGLEGGEVGERRSKVVAGRGGSALAFSVRAEIRRKLDLLVRAKKVLLGKKARGKAGRKRARPKRE